MTGLQLCVVCAVSSEPIALTGAITPFELLLTCEGKKFRAQVLHTPHGKALPSQCFTLAKIDLNEVDALREAFINGRSTTADHDRIKQLGSQLFKTAFSGEVRESFLQSLAIAQFMRTALKVRLRVESDDLSMLPWEMMFCVEGGGFLTTSQQVTFTRFTWTGCPTAQRKVTNFPLVILIHVCDDPGGEASKLQAKREVSLIRKALGPLLTNRSVAIRTTSGGTWDALKSALDKEGTRVDVLHIIGHGDMQGAEGVILMGATPVNATTLATRLQQSGISLAVLNTCKGAMGRTTDALAGIAQKLVRTAIPSVVAMQFSISDDAAIAFSSEFYGSLAKRAPLDLAVTRARINMVGLNSFEWMTPVLYDTNPDAVPFALPPSRPKKFRKKIPISKAAEVYYRDRNRRLDL